MVDMGEEMDKNSDLGVDSWRDRASTTTFVFPGLYTILKLYPCNLAVHFCCSGVWIVWDNRVLRLF